jgi:hypothetical protein
VLLEPPIPVPTLSASRSLDEADEMDENDAYDTEEGIELPESALYPHGTLDGGAPPGMANATSSTTSPLAFVIVNGLIARVRQNRRHRQLQRQEQQQQLPSSPTKAAASTLS